jgi:hypothetical protein
MNHLSRDPFEIAKTLALGDGSMAGALSESEDAVNSCKLAGPKRCKNASVIAKAQTAATTGDLYTNLCAGLTASRSLDERGRG